MMHKSLLLLFCSTSISYGMEHLDFPSNRYDVIREKVSLDGTTKSIIVIDKATGEKEGYFGRIGPVDPLLGRILSDNATPQEKAQYLNRITQEVNRLEREREAREIHKGVHLH